MVHDTSSSRSSTGGGTGGGTGKEGYVSLAFPLALLVLGGLYVRSTSTRVFLPLPLPLLLGLALTLGPRLRCLSKGVIGWLDVDPWRNARSILLAGAGGVHSPVS
jgi:hypothetical protein